VISALNLEVLPREKYLLKNAVDRASQVVKELGSSLRSQSLALSVSKKGKSQSDYVGGGPVKLDGAILH